MNFDEVIRIGSIFSNTSLAGRVYSIRGICASITANGGYHEPIILLNYGI